MMQKRPEQPTRLSSNKKKPTRLSSLDTLSFKSQKEKQKVTEP